MSFASLTTAVCTVSGTTATFATAGPCTIQASQSGNANYAAATPVSQSFSVIQKTQTITFNTIPTQVLGTPLTLSASASFGLPVSFASLTTAVCTLSGTTVTVATTGTCTIQASQSGNATYAAATPVSQSFSLTYKVVALYNQTLPNSSGATVPIKVQLKNYSSKNLSSSGLVLTIAGLSPSPAPGTAPSGPFTFMGNGDSGPMYQYNVKTTRYPSNTYTLSFKASGDAVVHTVQFVIH